MKVYTRTGDDGTTGLLFGGRVPKDDLRTEAYGTVDEAVAALGLARAEVEDQPRWAELLLELERELFVVGAQLATGSEAWHKLQPGVSRATPDMVERLETRIDEIEQEFPLPQEFIVPGGSRASAAVDLGRATARRAERRTVLLVREGLLEDDVCLRYLNRLSDLLFVLARALEPGRTVPVRVPTDNDKEPS